ncbi:hypothetical protein NDU88_004527 [Pleurodeles waltl]|uniref:Reverse transcriptase domain-containing protein n=1 Tax=Pleurodeles waltl TaxID=8319 RepID=A0AAV7TS89_PLEWA|nr:hypothetical protein NDU88_004527 [Pleurodeles waltl]
MLKRDQGTGMLPDRPFIGSVESGVMPNKWYDAVMRPVLKKPHPGPRDVNNYRPIFLLPVLGKNWENHINQNLANHLEENQLLYPSQMGFRAQHSTESALLAGTEELKYVLDQGEAAAIILLDLSAAFDTVNHKILVQRLKEVGVQDKALK